MNRCFYSLVIVVVLGIIGNTAFAQEVSEKEAKKDLLINNITALRNQEVRVMVLQQILNEETSKLMQVQAVFCDQYNLDVEKFRAGVYRYDAEKDEFTERKPGEEIKTKK